MMAAGHSVSGAAAGLYAATLARDTGLLDIGPAATLTGAALCAGAALLPDLDHPNATVAKTFGPASMALARAVNEGSGAVYRSTKTTRDERRDGGHRGLTHTAAFAATLGGLVALLTHTVPASVYVVLFVLLALALRGLLPDLHRQLGRRWRGTLGVLAASGVLTWLLAAALPASDVGPWLGAMVALGCLTHCAGDAVTEMGCPILWPVPIGGQRWRLIGPPKILRFRAGGGVERWIVMPVLVLAAVALTALAVPDVADAVAVLLP